MYSDDITPGARYVDPTTGQTVYTVLDKRDAPPHVIATVQFVDGGTTERMWEAGKTVPNVVYP